MFCPKCGVKNLDDVKFCRACGTDIHLVPQALAGRLKEKEKGEKVAKAAEPPTLEKGLENIFGAVAFFLIVALGYVYFVGYFFVWIWFLIPAFEHIGKGVGQVIASRRRAPTLAHPDFGGEPQLAPAPHTPAPHALPAADTSEIAPPSVTEQTTRSLEQAAPGAPRNAH